MIENFQAQNSLHRPVEFTLDQCIKCNICTSVCPVSAVTDLFPGPKYEAPQGGRFRISDSISPDRSVDYCSGCRVCNLACPAGVKIAEINARARAEMIEDGGISPILRFRNNIIARAELVGKVARPIAPLANAALNFPPARIIAEKTLGISRHAPFPAISHQRFTDWFNRHENSNPQKSRGKVAFFHGCSTQYYEPRIGRAAVQVLEALGYEIVIPPQNCCGLPLLSNGEFPAARKLHIRNVRSLVQFAREGIPIVGTSTSCTLTLKEEASELLEMRDEDTLLVANHVYDFNEFLLSQFETGQLVQEFDPIPLELPYHVPCQYKAHRLGRPGVDLLNRIPSLTIVESDALCCGIAGTYGYKREKYEISMQVGAPLFEFIKQARPPVVICDSETCRWQIAHATGYPVVHPVELLAVSLGFKPEYPLASIFT